MKQAIITLIVLIGLMIAGILYGTNELHDIEPGEMGKVETIDFQQKVPDVIVNPTLTISWVSAF